MGKLPNVGNYRLWVESKVSAAERKKSADCKSFKNCLPQLSDTKGLKAKIPNLLTMRKKKKQTFKL